MWDKTSREILKRTVCHQKSDSSQLQHKAEPIEHLNIKRLLPLLLTCQTLHLLYLNLNRLLLPEQQWF